MPTTFGDVVARCLDLVDRRDARTEPALRELVVLNLRRLSSHRMPWGESSFSFGVTVAGAVEYVRGDGKLPADFLLALDVWPVSSSTGERSEGRLELMASGEAKTRRDGRVVGYSHWKYGLRFAGEVTVGDEFEVDYLRDGMIDAAGARITSSSDLSTNDWLDQADDLIRLMTLRDYYLGVQADAERAQLWGAVADETLEHFRGLRGAGQGYVVPEAIF
jgi:hypothetical protein